MGSTDREGIWINAAALELLPRRFGVADARSLVTRLPVHDLSNGPLVELPAIRSGSRLSFDPRTRRHAHLLDRQIQSLRRFFLASVGAALNRTSASTA